VRTRPLCRTNNLSRAYSVAVSLISLFALFISAGGHWAVLQSVAYTRMLVEFAQQGPLSTAVEKAFDHRYACSLCAKIRHGCDNERKAPSKLAEVPQQPELLVASGICSLRAFGGSGGRICFLPSDGSFMRSASAASRLISSTRISTCSRYFYRAAY
jgi:hypothetical protein